MALSQRKEKILKAVVSSYIDSCEPVSSLEIHDKYFPDVSSATIRNELSALEEMGYLAQPHISSGRVPTADAYRLYVEKLMPRKKLSRSELNIIKRYFNKKVNDIETMVRSTAKVISEITNLTAVGYVSSQKTDIIRSVRIPKITENLALFIIVTDRTVLKDTTVEVSSEIPEEYFYNAGQFMTSVFGGRTIMEVTDTDNIAVTVGREYKRIFDEVVRILKRYGDEGIDSMAVEGSVKILEQPEYNTAAKAKAMLELLEAKEQLVPMLHCDNNLQLNIKIGKDNEMGEGLPECAVVTATYVVDGKQVGNAGVIGPMRMDYSKVVSVLDCIGKAISSLDEEDFDEGRNDE